MYRKMRISLLENGSTSWITQWKVSLLDKKSCTLLSFDVSYDREALSFFLNICEFSLYVQSFQVQADSHWQRV